MHIITPTQIEAVAGEGELVPPPTTRSVRSAENLVVTIDRPELWPVSKALENEVSRK